MRRLVERVDLLLRRSWYVVESLLEDRIVIWLYGIMNSNMKVHQCRKGTDYDE